MNRLLQRFVADPAGAEPAPYSAPGPAPAAGHDARDNPQLESLLAPPPRAAVAGGPPRSSGARLYPLPPRSSSRGFPPASPSPGGPPGSSTGRSAPSGAPPPPPPPPAAPAPVAPDHPAFFYYQHNPYQYQATEFQRQQPHPPPPPSSSGSQRRGSGGALDAPSGLDDVPRSSRSTYETVDLSDDRRPLPGRVAPPRSPGAGPFFGASPADAFFQQGTQHPQVGTQHPHPQVGGPPGDGAARSVSDLFGPSASADPPPFSLQPADPGPAWSPPSNLSAAANGSAPSPRPLGIARSPVHKPTPRRLSSASAASARGAAPPLSARQLALLDRVRSPQGAGPSSKTGRALSVDLDQDRRGQAGDAARLADMYRLMAERLQGEKQALLQVVAGQADQIAALQRRVAALELRPPPAS